MVITALTYAFPRFLVTKSEITLASAHYELCSLSVTYLQLPFVDSELDTADIDDYVLDGSYSFLDYAVSCWVYHLLDWLPESQPQQNEPLATTLDLMLKGHFTAPAQAQTVAKGLRGALQPLQSAECYDALSQAVIWMRKVIASLETPAQNNILDFQEVIGAARQRIEWLSQASASEQQSCQLKGHYGENIFKCSRLWCPAFNTGFKDPKSRDTHVERHDRPFLCSFEACPNATFSCASKRDLNAHLAESHGIVQEANEFPPVCKPGTGVGQRGEAQYACPQCDQRFTRKHVLREHLGGHPGQLPYVCGCGKAFATSTENKTHRKVEHFDAERFVCQGTLEAGGERWGCSRKIRSFDGLKYHWRRRDCLPSQLKESLKKHLKQPETIFQY